MNKAATESPSLSFLDSIADIEPATWNALAGLDYPFLRHEFLLALEDTGCVGIETGWRPRHAVVRDGAGELIALAPLYLKSHSYGEYVFDWSWADAYRKHGLEYYPKLVSAVPFTPSAGPRLCVSPAVDTRAMLTLLIRGMQEEARRLDASGLHVLFPEEAQSEALVTLGLRRRAGCQYQWFNEDFRDFAHFLEKFSSRKRKNLRKERRTIEKEGISFEVLEGAAITPAHWRRFYAFYQSTYFVRGRHPYLSRRFFERIGELMPDALLLVMAHRAGEPVAGALSFKGADTLYGRYWGCSEEYRFLHFETCYYQGIDYCIRKGLRRFDSGAQGEHKIQRGFEPVHTWSNHWLAHPQFERAIARFLLEEAQYVGEYMDHAAEFLPFRQGDGE